MENQKEKILVTGGAGFIGSHLVDRLVAQEYPVVVVDNLSSGSLENIHPDVISKTNGCCFYEIDIRNPNLEDIFDKEQPVYIYHLAAHVDVRVSVTDPLYDGDINIVGGLHILKNALRTHAKKIIFSSSGGAIYGELPDDMEAFPHDFSARPESPYGWSKFFFEKYLQFAHDAHDLDFVSLRFSNIYGPRQGLSKECGVISIFTKALFSGNPLVIFGDGHQTRDYLFVDDCIDMLTTSRQDHIQGAYNLSTGKKTSVLDLVQLLSLYTDTPPTVHYDEAKKGEVRHNCLDASITKEYTGWEPRVSLEEGLRRTFEWMRARKV